jgi:hypothetical protein
VIAWVCIPTVPGREEQLARCKAAYQNTAPDAEYDVLYLDVRTGYATCGEAWNDSAEAARAAGAAIFHATADDLVPSPSWYSAAMEAIEQGFTPCPIVWTEHEDGHKSIESSGGWRQLLADWTMVEQSVIPFCRVEHWEPIPPIHYFSDNAFSGAQARLGRPCVTRYGYEFLHTWAQPGRRPMAGEAWDTEREAWLAYLAGGSVPST